MSDTTSWLHSSYEGSKGRQGRPSRESQGELAMKPHQRLVLHLDLNTAEVLSQDQNLTSSPPQWMADDFYQEAFRH